MAHNTASNCFNLTIYYGDFIEKMMKIFYFQNLKKLKKKVFENEKITKSY